MSHDSFDFLRNVFLISSMLIGLLVNIGYLLNIHTKVNNRLAKIETLLEVITKKLDI